MAETTAAVDANAPVSTCTVVTLGPDDWEYACLGTEDFIHLHKQPQYVYFGVTVFQSSGSGTCDHGSL